VSLFSLICCVTQWNAARLQNKCFGENEVEAVLQRLDRLTQDEARMTAAEIFKVVHGVVQNMNGSMDSKKTRSAPPNIG
jgi:hypothetical protein